METTIEKATRIKKETGAVLIWGVQYENTDNWVKMYNDNQVEFMKEVCEKYSIFSNILNQLFDKNRNSNIDELRNLYLNAIDFE